MMQTRPDLPILIVTFNRPEQFSHRLKEILNQTLKPDKLFVSIDGPRSKNKDDSLSQDRIRNTLENFNSSFEIEVIERSKNLGLSVNILDSISFVLTKYDQLIVVEDDVSIAPNFYENFSNGIRHILTSDSQISTIGGYSPLIINKSLKKFEYFLPKNKWRSTIYFHSWGWATSKNFWDQLTLVDKDTNFEEFFENSLVWRKFSDRKRKIWLSRFRRGVWDYQLQANLFRLNQNNLFPYYSLIDNQGIGDIKSTHTKNKKPFYLLRNAFPKTIISDSYRRTGLIWKFIESNTLAADGHFNARGRSIGIRTFLKSFRTNSENLI